MMMIKLKALNDFVIVKHEMNEEKVSESGLVLSEENTEADRKAVVLSIGDNVSESIERNVKVGDTIWFSKYVSIINPDSLDKIKILTIQSCDILSVEK